MFISTLTPARVRRQLYAYFSDLDSSDDHDTDNIVWVLKRVVGPLFLLLTLTWEYQAVDRFPAEAFDSAALMDGDKPSRAGILKRISDQSFEQTVMVVGVAVALAARGADDTCYTSFTNSTTGELAADEDQICLCSLGVAHAFCYMIFRPFYALGYLQSPGYRLFGLLAGGFWFNIGWLIYAALVQSGVPDSPFLLYAGAGVGPVLVLAALGLKLASLPKDGDESAEAEQKALTAQDDSTA